MDYLASHLTFTLQYSILYSSTGVKMVFHLSTLESWS